MWCRFLKYCGWCHCGINFIYQLKTSATLQVTSLHYILYSLTCASVLLYNIVCLCGGKNKLDFASFILICQIFSCVSFLNGSNKTRAYGLKNSYVIEVDPVSIFIIHFFYLYLPIYTYLHYNISSVNYTLIYIYNNK